MTGQGKQSVFSHHMSLEDANRGQSSFPSTASDVQVPSSQSSNVGIGVSTDDCVSSQTESNYGSFPSVQFETPPSSNSVPITTAMLAPPVTSAVTDTTTESEPVLRSLTTPSPSSSASQYQIPPARPVNGADELLTSTAVTIKNESEDIFRDCTTNLHMALPTINPNGKDWVDMGRDGLYTGIMLAMPDQGSRRTPRPLTLIGYVTSSYLASPSTLNSGPSGWSLKVGISETTFRDLFRLVNTCSRKVRIRKDGQTNFFVPFRMVEGRYELKLRAKVSYFEAVRVATIRDGLERSKSALRQIAKDAIGPTSSSNSSKLSATTFANSSEIEISSSDDDDIDDGDDGEDVDVANSSTIESKDWTSCPFPNIYDSTELPPSPASEFLPTSYTDIVPRSLVAVRFHTQFWDFGVDGKQKTGYSLLLESLHLLNYSSDHRSDLQPKPTKKRPNHTGPDKGSDRPHTGAEVGVGGSKRRAKPTTPAFRKATYLDL